jgi:hypothetical protein
VGAWGPTRKPEAKAPKSKPPADIESGGSANEPFDEETNSILFQGASVRQLAQMFHADPAVVTRKISGIVPVGRRRGANIYRIDEAAARLVKPGYEIERYIREMNHLDLPPMLGVTFWDGQRKRLTFEENNGDLWRTADVVHAFGEVFNTLRMSLMLMADAVERETSLTDTQRVALRRLIDGAMEDCRTRLTEKFKDYGNGPNGGNEFESIRLVELAEDDGDDGADAGGTGVLDTPADADEYHGL